MTDNELERMVKSHEKALCYVADTEGMALKLIRRCFALALAALALALAALFMAVTP